VTWGDAGVNAWWWVPIGLVAWFLVAVAVGLCLGPVLRRSAAAREAVEHQWMMSQEPPAAGISPLHVEAELRLLARWQ
jgi:hypothetical protein